MKKRRVLPVGNGPEGLKETSIASKELIEEIRTYILAEIVNARYANNATQVQVSAVSGVHQAVIARLENGVKDPTLTTMIKILRPLGMTMGVVPLRTVYPK
jgi:DNA-binding XRE family transcriptional regulator